MLAMRLEILGNDPELKNVVQVQVPSIYSHKTVVLPKRMAKLVLPAAIALQKVYEGITKEGGHLYISDMFRSADDQQKAHQDYISGRKADFSPPSCNSVHEAARAIDIDAFDTGIGHKRVREILKEHGWVNIVETLTGSECWHYEFRGDDWQGFHDKHGCAAMARAMKEEIGNLVGVELANVKIQEMKWVQETLNKIQAANLETDGIFGNSTREAVKKFQKDHDLQVDGVPGPITKNKMKQFLEQA